MAADSAGNDIQAVGVPLTGFLAYAPESATIPTPVEGASSELVLGQDFRKVGLVTQDGGFEWTEEPDGDPIEFWQDGYSIPTGLATVQLTFTAAEESAITRVLRTGKTPDGNGYVTVDGGGSSKRYVFFSEELYRNGAIRRRVAYGRILTAKLQKSERGTPQGIEFTVEVQRHAAFDSNHYGEWVIPAADPIPATGATAGEPGSWTPSGATPPASVIALQSGGITASPATAWTAGQYVQTGTAGVPGEAHWDGDSWEPGRA